MSTIITQARPGAFASLQCGRNVHNRAIVPVPGWHRLHDGSRGRAQQRESWDWQTQERRRYASTSTTATTKTGYGRAPAPIPPAKASKINLPAKTAYTSKLTPDAKISRSPTTVPANSPASKTTTGVTVKAKEKLNPPSSTYAPEVVVPVRKADQSFVSWLWKTGRAYLSFYKTGVSHVRQTLKLAKQLRQRAAKEGPGRDISELLTRAEWQIVQRSKKDWLRLPAMGVLILLLGEWTPLIVLYITPIIPEACRIPKQVKRDLIKRESRRADRLQRLSRDAMRLQLQDKRPIGSGMNIDMQAFEQDAKVVPAGRTVHDLKARNMTLFELMLFSATHDCHSRIWDWLQLTPPKSLLQRSVQQKLDYLSKDDRLIERDGGFAALGKQEVERACVERGINVLGKKEDELRKALVVQWNRGRS